MIIEKESSCTKELSKSEYQRHENIDKLLYQKVDCPLTKKKSFFYYCK